MKLAGIEHGITDWSKVETAESRGDTGFARQRVRQFGDIRARIVEYSPGYKADHWCLKGHIVLCIEGEFTTELKDGRKFELKAGMGYQVSDDAEAHRTFTEKGAKLYIVD